MGLHVTLPKYEYVILDDPLERDPYCVQTSVLSIELILSTPSKSNNARSVYL
jgi:hypothetical protein